MAALIYIYIFFIEQASKQILQPFCRLIMTSRHLSKKGPRAFSAKKSRERSEEAVNLSCELVGKLEQTQKLQFLFLLAFLATLPAHLCLSNILIKTETQLHKSLRPI